MVVDVLVGIVVKIRIIIFLLKKASDNIFFFSLFILVKSYNQINFSTLTSLWYRVKQSNLVNFFYQKNFHGIWAPTHQISRSGNLLIDVNIS